MSAGIAVNALGHADKGVAQAVYEQASRATFLATISVWLTNGPFARPKNLCMYLICTITNGLASSPSFWSSRHFGMAVLAFRLLAQQVPLASKFSLPVGRPFFIYFQTYVDYSATLSDSGTEANEGALKFVRKAGKTHQSKSKHEIVCFSDGFHGRTFGALSATQQEKYQAPFAPLVPGFKAGKLNDIAGLKELVTEATCGVIVEPIQVCSVLCTLTTVSSVFNMPRRVKVELRKRARSSCVHCAKDAMKSELS
jgi:hypothetical protein